MRFVRLIQFKPGHHNGVGTGTTTLSLNNTYTGATNVNKGTLGGTGTASGALTANSGGIMARGTSIGSFTTGALTLASGSIFSYQIPCAGHNSV